MNLTVREVDTKIRIKMFISVMYFLKIHIHMITCAIRFVRVKVYSINKSVGLCIAPRV